MSVFFKDWTGDILLFILLLITLTGFKVLKLTFNFQSKKKKISFPSQTIRILYLTAPHSSQRIFLAVITDFNTCQLGFLLFLMDFGSVVTIFKYFSSYKRQISMLHIPECCFVTFVFGWVEKSWTTKLCRQCSIPAVTWCVE